MAASFVGLVDVVSLRLPAKAAPTVRQRRANADWHDAPGSGVLRNDLQTVGGRPGLEPGRRIWRCIESVQ